ELEVGLEMRAQKLEVGLLLGGAPGRERKRRGLGHLPDELRWDPRCLLVVPARHADQAGLEGLVAGPLLDVAKILEQPADVRRHESLLCQAAETRQRFRSRRGSAG